MSALQYGRVYDLNGEMYIAGRMGAPGVDAADFIEFLGVVTNKRASANDIAMVDAVLIVDGDGNLCELAHLADGEEAEHPVLEDYGIALVRMGLTVDDLVLVDSGAVSYADALASEQMGDGNVDMGVWGEFFNILA